MRTAGWRSCTRLAPSSFHDWRRERDTAQRIRLLERAIFSLLGSGNDEMLFLLQRTRLEIMGDLR